MAEPKTQPTEVSLEQFLESVADEARRADCRTIANMMQEATGAPPVMWGGSIVGFGRYRYRYQSGREGEWPIIGFSSRKNDLTLYLAPCAERMPTLLERLGKHKTGKACLYIKKLADVDQEVLKELIAESVEAMAAQRIA